MSEQKQGQRKKLICSAILLFLGNVLFFLTLWLLRQYDKICFDQFLFNFKTSSKGLHRTLAGNGAVGVGLYSSIAFVLEVLVYKLLSGAFGGRMAGLQSYRLYCGTRICGFFKKYVLPISLAVLLVCSAVFVAKLDVIAYVDAVHTESDFIEAHYADPENTPINFREKRNLIYIFLESMESTYADTEAGGNISTDFIPELSALAEENVSFSHKKGIGGAFSYFGTTWTAAAMVSQTAGVPVKVPFGADVYGTEEHFMPGVSSIGEILEKEGYSNTLIMGSDAEFHGREQYFVQHGNYNIIDKNSLKEQGRLPLDYDEWWGFEDEKLFSFAKEELIRLADEGRPFNLTLLTADTHFPDGYLCRLCREEHEEQYANVLSCSSKQVWEFVSWIKTQPFYENTVIVISGDHLTMDPGFLSDIEENYKRSIYNCIINPAKEPIKEKCRSFASFDMLPTTLSAMGADIEGSRLCLGTDLFSDTPTLAELYGYEALDTELQKNSEFYNTRILHMEEE